MRKRQCQWWQLRDPSGGRLYYYRLATRRTAWHRRDLSDADIVSLTTLQASGEASAMRTERPFGHLCAATSSSGASSSASTRSRRRGSTHATGTRAPAEEAGTADGTETLMLLLLLPLAGAPYRAITGRAACA